jgi:hypothetical protein
MSRAKFVREASEDPRQQRLDSFFTPATMRELSRAENRRKALEKERRQKSLLSVGAVERDKTKQSKLAVSTRSETLSIDVGVNASSDVRRVTVPDQTGAHESGMTVIKARTNEGEVRVGFLHLGHVTVPEQGVSDAILEIIANTDGHTFYGNVDYITHTDTKKPLNYRDIEHIIQCGLLCNCDNMPRHYWKVFRN